MRRRGVAITIFQAPPRDEAPARGFMEARSVGKSVSPLALSDKYKRVVKARSCGAAPVVASTTAASSRQSRCDRVARRARRVVEELLEEAVRPRQAHGGLDRSFYSLRRDELVSR